MNRGKRDKIGKGSGFTLMELVVVIGVILMLSFFLLLTYRGQLGKGRDGRRKGDMDLVKIALENYIGDHACYPEEAEVVCDSTALAPYLGRVPCDPSGGSYKYYRPECKKFILFASLDRSNDPIIESKECSFGCGPNYAYNYYVKSDNAVQGEDFGVLLEGEELVEPTCGSGENKTCVANTCSSCCPGSSYRCDLTGSWCIEDASCVQ